MEFFGRTEELKELHEAFDSDHFEALLLYGRRRVGKTEIIKQAIADLTCKVIHCECKRSSLYDNLQLMSEKVAGTFALPEGYVFPNIDRLFDYVFQKSEEENIVFVIDEFSFLLEADKSIDSSLAIAIDHYKGSSHLKLVVSGSYVKLMEDMIDANAPLYGRFNHILQVQPFDYYTASMFYPHYTDEEKIYMYSIFGGIAYFNSLIDDRKSPKENVLDLIVRENSILEHEVNETILAETRRLGDLNAVISLVGKGVTKYSDILANLSQDQSARPTYALNKLLDMKILRKVAPINDKTNKKKTYYAFEDNLMHFYYRFIFNHLDSRNVMQPEDFYDIFIQEDLESHYIPHMFEEITKEFLIRMNRAHKIHPIFTAIGTYSYNDAQKKTNREFDVVTRDTNGYISYECKYTAAPLDLSVIREEEYQTDGLDIAFYKLGFVSRSGFTGDVDSQKYNLFELKDFYAN